VIISSDNKKDIQMFKKILILLILSHNIAPQAVFAEEFKKVFSEPLKFNAKVGYEEDYPYYWIQIFNKKEFYKVLKHTTGANTNKHKQAYKVKVYGLKKERFTDTYMNLKEIQDKYVDTIIVSQEFAFNCLGIDLKKALLCELYIGDINLAESMIRDGLSQFDKSIQITDEVNQRYIDAELSAENDKIGIWKSFVGLFSFDKENIVK
jgi:hypothetical protein